MSRNIAVILSSVILRDLRSIHIYIEQRDLLLQHRDWVMLERAAVAVHVAAAARAEVRASESTREQKWSERATVE